MDKNVSQRILEARAIAEKSADDAGKNIFFLIIATAILRILVYTHITLDLTSVNYIFTKVL